MFWNGVCSLLIDCTKFSVCCPTVGLVSIAVIGDEHYAITWMATSDLVFYSVCLDLESPLYVSFSRCRSITRGFCSIEGKLRGLKNVKFYRLSLYVTAVAGPDLRSVLGIVLPILLIRFAGPIGCGVGSWMFWNDMVSLSECALLFMFVIEKDFEIIGRLLLSAMLSLKIKCLLSFFLGEALGWMLVVFMLWISIFEAVIWGKIDAMLRVLLLGFSCCGYCTKLTFADTLTSMSLLSIGIGVWFLRSRS